ncbi:hypothetical protein [Jiella marina]|uniref:hypothetical protein n=1 Tax=Jiella sp. LLJ827 TaxID=2917712 RepID=UPI002100C2C1|nr:hypothetical protein [Jiella sp. LLJ827]MCQ0986613.1 hypothetical protein [Jiella sp. LLJ827]
MACIATVCAMALPAGPPAPLMIRVVTMQGETGPAYYSTTEQGFRFVGGAPIGHGERIAINATAADDLDRLGGERGGRVISQ